MSGNFGLGQWLAGKSLAEIEELRQLFLNGDFRVRPLATGSGPEAGLETGAASLGRGGPGSLKAGIAAGTDRAKDDGDPGT